MKVKLAEKLLLISGATSEYRVVFLYLFWITTIFQTNILFKTNKCHYRGPPWSGGPGAIALLIPLIRPWRDVISLLYLPRSWDFSPKFDILGNTLVIAWYLGGFWYCALNTYTFHLFRCCQQESLGISSKKLLLSILNEP